MDNNVVTLTYNVWNGEYMQGHNIDHKGLTVEQINRAIQLYKTIIEAK